MASLRSRSRSSTWRRNCRRIAARWFVTVVAVGVGFALRVLAIRFNWSMPKFIYNKDLR